MTTHQKSMTESTELEIESIARTMWAGRWIILFSATFFSVISLYYSFRVVTPLYSATAVVMMNTQETNIVNLDSVVGGLTGDSTEINTEVEVLKSNSLLERVVENLSLQDDPEFNSSLRELTAGEKLRAKIRLIFGNSAEADSIEISGVAEQRVRDRVTRALRDALSIKNVPQTLVFRIQVTTQDPIKSKLIADEVAQQYIRDQVNAKLEATALATDWLTKHVSELKIEVEDAERRVAEFQSSTSLVSEQALSGMQSQIKDVRERIEGNQEVLNSLLSKQERLNSARTAQEIVEAANDRQLDALYVQVLRGSIARLEDSEPFQRRLKEIRGELSSQISRNRSQISALENSRDEMQKEVEAQNNELIQLQQLTREAESSRLLYEFFLNRYKEITVQQGIQQPDSRTLSRAEFPGAPSAPKKTLIFLMSVVLGSLFGIAVVAAREMGSKTFRVASDVEIETGRPVMGQIPTFPASRRKQALEYIVSKPTSAASEAIRNLRTSLTLSRFDSPPQVIVVTSSIPGEGKSTVSLTLANNYAVLGKKTLLIEGDIRRRVFNQYLREDEGSAALLKVLSGELNLQNAVLRSDLIGADVLLSEDPGTRSLDIFASQKFSEFLAEARKSYDTIIIDTPPVLVVPDARQMARHADAVVFTVKWDSTKTSQVQEGLRFLDLSPKETVGIVINQINPKKMKAYGYGGNYGSYAAYGNRYYTN